MNMTFFKIRILILFTCIVQFAQGQSFGKINWTADGNYYTKLKEGNIIQVDPKTEEETVVIKNSQITDPVTKKLIVPQSYQFNSNYTRVLLFTNTAKVWRYKTRGRLLGL